MRRFSLLALVTLVLGCDPSLANRAAVYPAVTGKFDVKWTVDAPGADVVVVRLDGTEVGRTTDLSASFLVELDSTKFPNGLHLLRLEALTKTGTTVKVLEHTVLLQN